MSACLFVGVWSLVAVVAGCSDSLSSKPVDEDATAWTDLGGPPGDRHIFLGRLGERTCYLVEHGVEVPVVGCYVPGEGWREDRALAEVVNRSEYDYQVQGRIRRAGDADFLLNVHTGVVHRTGDLGATWEAKGTVPDGVTIESFETDGRWLFLAGREDGRSGVTLWRSRDEGRSWEVLRDDAVGPSHVVVLPGLLFGSDVMSVDGGDSWTTRPESCVNAPGAANWYHLDGRYLFIHHRGVGEFDAVRGCVQHELGHSLEALALHRGELFGVTNGGELGRIDGTLSRWEPIALPQGLEFVVEPHYGRLPGLIDLGAEGLVGWMTSGLWISRDAGETWSSIAHPYSAPRWLVEHDGKLLAPGAGYAYARDVDGGDWQWEPGLSGFASNHVVVREGRLFGLGVSTAGVFVPGGASSLGELIWQDEPFSLDWFNYRPRAALHVHGDRAFIASSRLYRTASAPYLEIALPGSEAALEAAAHSYVGGGVHVADSIDGPFTHFGEGLTDAVTGSHLSVASVAFDDDHIWAVTALHGVWRARLDDGQWAEAHEGLPRAGAGESTYPVRRLVALDGTLYALSHDALFVRDTGTWFSGEPGAWLPVADGFASDAAGARRDSPLGLLDLVAHRGELLAVAWDGIDRLDPTTGARERIWTAPREILGADVLPSGLYIRLAGGGVWRYR